MKVINKNKGFIALLVLLVLVLAVGVSFAKNEPNPVTYTDHQRFRSDITINSPNSSDENNINFGDNSQTNFQSGSELYFDSGSGVTFSGDMVYGTTISMFKKPVMVSFSGTSYYTLSKANGSLFWLDAVGHGDGTRATTSGVSIILPKITSAYNGYVAKFFVAHGLNSLPGASGATVFSGTTPIVFTTAKWSSGTTDHIWSGNVGNGFVSGATYESATQIVPEYEALNGPGEWIEFTAFYHVSGSTWYMSGCSI